MTIDPDLERDYSPSSAIGGNWQPFAQRWHDGSVAAREHLSFEEHDGAITVGSDDRPLVVFVHGGYWQEGSADDALFLAPGVLAAGFSFAAVRYRLAPEATVEEMVVEVGGRVAALASRWREGLVLVGHSAGAHLAAMVAVAQPAPAVRRVVLVSGVYELTPLLRTSVNAPLQLDEQRAAALSPARLPVVGRPDAVVVWGEIEPPPFGAQGAGYAERLAAAGLDVVAFEVAARNHFDVLFDLADRSTALGAATLRALR